MTTDPAVPAPDVLAVERFRTVLTDSVVWAQRNETSEVDSVLAEFPSAQFVHDVNSAGVPVRRLVVHGEWEVDPNPPKVDPRLGEAARVLGPSLTSPADPYRTDAPPIPWAPAESPTHPFEPVRYKGRIEEGCGHFTRINSHEGTMCGEPRSATIHPPVFTCCNAHDDQGEAEPCCENCPDALPFRLV